MSAEKKAYGAALRDELEGLHARIAPRFGRKEVRERTKRYLVGLLGPVERRTGWQMAKQIGEERPDGVQRLLNAARWDADAVRDDLRDYVVERLGDTAGALVLAETGFRKRGKKSAGVARQRNPTTGREENCQVGLFLVYSSPRGWAFIDWALYLPEEWAEDEVRCREAGVPEGVGFYAKGELARAMLERTFEAGVPASWVSSGGFYGEDEKLLQWLEERERSYVLGVEHPGILPTVVYGSYTRAWWEMLMSDASAWKRAAVDAGSNRARVHEWKGSRLPYGLATGGARWLLVRRSVSGAKELVLYRAYGPEKTPLAELERVADTCWTIEEGLERAKGEVGLDQYEVRRWDAWHRHIALCLLAHTSLQVTRAQAEGDGVRLYPA